MLRNCTTGGQGGLRGDAADVQWAQGAVAGQRTGPWRCTTLRFTASSPYRRCFPQPSPPSLSAFINRCCSVRLHSLTPGVSAVPEVPAGQLSSSSGGALFMAMFSNVCFLFLLCLFGRSRPCSSHTDCATGTLSHIYSHRKDYCTLYKHFDFRMKTGYTLAYRDCLKVSLYMGWACHCWTSQVMTDTVCRRQYHQQHRLFRGSRSFFSYGCSNQA